jgi:hypothetical protein
MEFACLLHGFSSRFPEPDAIRRSLTGGPATADPRLLEAGSEREGAPEVNLMEDFSRNDND